MAENKIKSALLNVREHAYVARAKMDARFHHQEIEKPVFILGCGRSGTTILGTCLSHHSQITYLNERRYLWKAIYPETDIWSNTAESSRGKLVLTESDTDDERSMMLRRLFHYQVVQMGRPKLVEKLPINNFRVRFIKEIFPDALYIHILRHGIEVARSIERYEQTKGWYSNKSYRLELLKKYAAKEQATAGLFEQCDNAYEMGLLEWRLSLDSLNLELNQIPQGRLIQVTYNNLVSNTQATLDNIFHFLNLPSSDEVATFAIENISRRSPKIEVDTYTNKEKMLAGKWLGQMYRHSENKSDKV